MNLNVSMNFISLGYSPFTMRDVASKSAQLALNRHELKYWMRKNPNESRGKRK